MNPHYPAVARRAAHRCEYCPAPEVAFNLPFEVEHVFPSSRGGSDDDTNLAHSCRACNLHKADATAGTDETTGAVADLFDPRAGRWADHFAFDPDTGTLTGLTPAGRATIARLDRNHPLQLAARDLWVRLGLYP